MMGTALLNSGTVGVGEADEVEPEDAERQHLNKNWKIH